ncbi:MAG: hypothetical protein IKQ24_09880, partial [Verrucomicrobia bacterium]|nr:hypothetical protein [Verrucomicrobiota bacterium]
MRNTKEKGMWKRTLNIFPQIKIPWHLYVIQVILGIIVARLALLYIPYLANIQQGKLDQPGVISGYLGYYVLHAVVNVAYRVSELYATAIVTRNLQNKMIGRA